MGLDKRNLLTYAHWWNFFQSLPDDRHRVRLLNAMFGYAFDGELPNFNDLGVTSVLLDSYFAIIKQQRDADTEHYIARCQHNKTNGQKGGRAKAVGQAIASETYQSLDTFSDGKQSVANLADIEHDTEPDIELGNDSGNSMYTGSNLQPDSSSCTLDYAIVTKQIELAYKKLAKQGEQLLSLEDTIQIFQVFYNEFLSKTGIPHPRLAQNKMEFAVKALPYYEDEYGEVNQIDFDDYQEIIPKYFGCNFKKCNYSILHFLSGKNRNNRLIWQEG